MFDNKYQKKEMPLTGLISLGGGVGGLAVTGKSGEVQQLKVIRSNGSQVDISQQPSYSFQDGDIIEPILADYTVTITCAGKRGLRNSSYTTVNQGYGAWVQGTINMRYGTKYYVRISDGIGALYWGDSGSDNNLCMMLGAEGGHGKKYLAGFYEDHRDWANNLSALGLGGNAGVCNSSGFSTGDPGQGSPGIPTSGYPPSPINVDASGGGGGSVTTHGSSGGSGGSGGAATGPSGARTGGTGGYFTKGTVDWTGVNVSGGGEGGMGYFGGGGGGSVLQHSFTLWSGGGGGGGASYAGGVPKSYLLNSSIDDASVTNITSQLNDAAATADTAFVRMESAPTVELKEEPYWGGYEYGAAVATWGGSPWDLRANANNQYGFYTRTGHPSVDSGDVGSPDGIRERQIIWDGNLVDSSGSNYSPGVNAVPAAAANANGWIIGIDGYAYSWVDIITKMFPNSTTDAIEGITSGGGSGPAGSYYPWDGDQCNCFNVMRVELRLAATVTADEMRPIVIERRVSHIVGTSPNDSYPLNFSSSDPV